MSSDNHWNQKTGISPESFLELMLAVTMTFALNLLPGIRPPVLAQNATSTKVDFAQILKVRMINLVSIADEK